ncbi:hypothetical protein ABZ615_23585 [Streptomyces sp. NPDC007325]|uniref:hypothetical protein n=1 Tax=Streptomyces sp. NPDC007325 TaxID=3154588 RepID=UPI0033C3A8A6
MPAALRRAASAPVCLAVTLPATACDPLLGDKTRPELLGRAIEATESAESVTLHIDVLSLMVPMKGSVSLDGRGNCVAVMSYGAAGVAELIRIEGREVYLRRDEALLRAQERHRITRDLLDDLAGRWTRPPADGPDAPGELALCDGRRTPLGLENGWEGDSAESEVTTVGGRRAHKLAKPVDGEGGTTTVSIAADGPPYLLKVVTTGGDEAGTTAFSHYGGPVGAKAPPAGSLAVTD